MHLFKLLPRQPAAGIIPVTGGQQVPLVAFIYSARVVIAQCHQGRIVQRDAPELPVDITVFHTLAIWQTVRSQLAGQFIVTVALGRHRRVLGRQLPGGVIFPCQHVALRVADFNQLTPGIIMEILFLAVRQGLSG